MGKHWFLHVKRKRGKKRYWAQIFLVNPILKVSIILDTYIGYPSGYKCIMGAKKKAIEEGKMLLKKYLRNELPPERERRGIQGTKTFSFSIV